MKRGTRLHLVAVAFLAGTLCAGSAPAQPAASPPPPSPLEAWGAVSAPVWTRTGTLDTNYPPQVTSAPDATGRLGQSLTLDPANGLGFEFGVNLFPWSHAGLQVFASRVTSDLAGTNTPYEVDLQYTSRPPPNYQPVPVAIDWTVRWPDTTGRLRQWALGGGPAFRWRSPAVSLVVSGGVAWVRLSGEAEPLGYTRLWLGGHSVLFSEDFQVRAALGPSTIVAGYASGALDVALGRHAAATLGVRALLAGDADVAARVDSVLDTGTGITPPGVIEFDQAMAPGPARLSPRGVAILAGVKIR